KITNDNIKILDGIIKNNNSAYNQMTTRNTQKELGYERDMINSIKKAKQRNQPGSEEYNTDIRKIFDTYRGRISNKKLEFLFDKVNQKSEQFTKEQVAEEEVEIKKEAEEIKKNKPTVTLDDIETTQVGVETELNEEPVVPPTKTEYNKINSLDDFGVVDNDEPIDYNDLFEPENIGPLDDNKKNTISNMVTNSRAILASKLGRAVSFKEHIQDVISEMGYEFAESRFNLFKLGYELNNIPGNFQETYDELFKNTKDLYSQFDDESFSEYIQGPLNKEEFQKETDDVVNEVLKDNSVIVDFDDNNQPITENEVDDPDAMRASD